MISVPLRVLIACAFLLGAAWSLGEIAFTIGLSVMAGLFLGWAAIGARPPNKPRLPGSER
ncbi:MAG: hypothetical protein ACKV2O_14675 [Acidimicrobiales bacterium]